MYDGPTNDVLDEIYNTSKTSSKDSSVLNADQVAFKNDGSKHVSESNLNADQVAFKKEGYNDVEESKPLSQRGDRDAGSVFGWDIKFCWYPPKKV